MLSTNYTLSPKEENSSPPPSSPKDQSQFFPATPKKLEEVVYPNEVKKVTDKIDKNKISPKKEEPTENEKEKKQSTKNLAPGELVTKVIQVERSPSKKLTPDQKPVVEIRERVVRTPSKKLSAENKPVVTKQIPSKQTNEPQNKVPPVKPARSKSSSRLAVSLHFQIFLILLLITLLLGLYYFLLI